MKLKTNLSLFIIELFIFITILFQFANQTSLNNNIQKPTLNKIQGKISVLNPLESNITLQSPDFLYIVSTQILQRSSSDKIITDQQKQKNDLHRFFHTSKSCKIIDPNIQLKKLFKQQILNQSQSIRQTYLIQYDIFNSTRTYIWILSDKYVQKYIIHQDMILSMGKVVLPQEIIKSFNFKFIKINQSVYLTNGYSIYLIEQDYLPQKGMVTLNNLKINYWKNLIKVQANQTLENKQKIIKIVQLNGSILLLTYKSLKTFKYVQSKLQFEETTNKNISQKLKQFLQSHNNTIFIDIAYDLNQQLNLFILTNNVGVIQIQSFNLPISFDITIHQIGQIGTLISFIKFSDAFEIIFKLSQESPTMIAQFQFSPRFFDKQTNKTIKNSSLILNRFYQKIRQVYDIDYILGRLLILSDNLFYVYGPGVNRQFLVDQNGKLDEYPYYGVCWDINQFKSLKRKSSNNTIKIIGIGEKHLTIYQFKRPNTTVQCSINQNMNIVVRTIGTCLKQGQQSLIKNACQTTHFYDLSVKKIDFELNVAFWFTIGIILFIIWLTLWNCLFLKFLSDGKIKIKKMINILMQKKKKKKTNQKSQTGCQYLKDKSLSPERTKKIQVQVQTLQKIID